MCPSLPAGVRIKCSAGDGIRGRADRESRGDAVHGAGIAGFADAYDLAVLDADVGFDDAEERVHHCDVGDHQVERAALARELVVHPHAVAQRLAAAVDGFIAIHAQILLDLNVEVGVTQADLVSDGRAEQARIFFTRYL